MGIRYKKENVVVVSDPHEPCSLPGAVDFIRDLKHEYRCGTVIFIGDLLDFAAISYHEKNPSLPSAEDEFNRAMLRVKQWKKLAPKAVVMTGNHDALNFRKAMSCGLPGFLLKEYSDLLDTPNWDWRPRYDTYIYNDVAYRHGDFAKGGEHAAIKNAKEIGLSLCQGHYHSQMSIDYFANGRSIIFGVQTGCLVDHDLLAMEYGRKFASKPLIGAPVIIGDQPILTKMDLGKYK